MWQTLTPPAPLDSLRFGTWRCGLTRDEAATKEERAAARGWATAHDAFATALTRECGRRSERCRWHGGTAVAGGAGRTGARRERAATRPTLSTWRCTVPAAAQRRLRVRARGTPASRGFSAPSRIARAATSHDAWDCGRVRQRRVSRTRRRPRPLRNRRMRRTCSAAAGG